MAKKSKMPSNDDEKIELTEEQKKQILDRWNDKNQKPPSLKELCQLVFGEECNGLDRRGRTVRAFLVSRNLKTKSIYKDYYKKPIELTDEQQEFVRNHCGAMPPLEMAKELFNNDKLWPNNLEVKAVEKYIKTIPRAAIYKPELDRSNLDEYKPPKTIVQAAARVSKYRYGDEISQEKLNNNSHLQLCLNTLIRYCHVPRFVLLMMNFANSVDRDLFESSFIRYSFDKPDLTEEEVDSYINLCLDIVNFTAMQREREKLTLMRDDSLEEKGGRVSLALVNAIKDLDSAMNENQKRQTKALENLNGKRSERMDGKIREAQSVLQLVQAWQDEQKRERFINLANLRKKAVHEETQRLETLDGFIAEIFGLDRITP